MFQSQLYEYWEVAIVLRGDRGLEPLCKLSVGIRRWDVAIVLRGDRGLEHQSVDITARDIQVAIVLRGDRGLEPLSQYT